jgi:tellurite resistance-related uncharacterized protein
MHKYYGISRAPLYMQIAVRSCIGYIQKDQVWGTLVVLQGFIYYYRIVYYIQKDQVWGTLVVLQGFIYYYRIVYSHLK